MPIAAAVAGRWTFCPTWPSFPYAPVVPMHFAFLGHCPESVDLARAAQSLGHRITTFVQAEAGIEWRDLGGKREPYDQWEALLDAPEVNGIVLAEAAPEEVDLRSDQWRRLAQSGARLLTVHPTVPALLVYLEVDMLARESGSVLLPFWRAAFSSAAGKVQAIGSGADYGLGRGALEQVSFRRHLHDRTPENVTRWFARDAALLDLLAGPFEEITAMGPDASGATYATLAVHLSGPRGIPVRWEVARPQDGGEHGHLMTTTADGETAIEFPEPPAAEAPRAAPSTEALAAIEAFEELANGGPQRLESWQRCVRAMELADSIEISLRRGRRIEVHYRQMTEETSYKGMMSAAGCGLLVVGLTILVTAGMLHAVFGWRLMRFWYVPVLVLFVSFLLLQLLAHLAARSPGKRPTEPPSGESGQAA